MTRSQIIRAENEVVFKQRNESMKNRVKKLVSDMDSDMPLQFICECSNENCTEPITLTVGQYTDIRINPRNFIIKPGHQQIDIEKVVHRGDYMVVEKFEVPGVGDGTLNITH